MQLLLEFLPVGAFFATYLYLKDIYTATIVLMAGMVLMLPLLWWRLKKLPMMFVASTAMVLVAGAATLLLRNPRFIQWKPTIFLWALALAFLVSAWVGQKPLAQRVLQPALGDQELDRRDWLKLNWSWVIYGAATGLANILVAYQASEATWVKIKTFGLLGTMLAFLFGQILWLQRSGKLKL